MKEKILFSLSLLILFVCVIETNQSNIVVSILAYLFLVSILPLLIDFFKPIFKSSISDDNYLEGPYVYKNTNIKFNWGSNSYFKRGNSPYFKSINNSIFFTKDDIASYKLVKSLMDNDKSALKLVLVDNNNVESFEIDDSPMLLCSKLTRQSNIDCLFKKNIRNNGSPI